MSRTRGLLALPLVLGLALFACNGDSGPPRIELPEGFTAFVVAEGFALPTVVFRGPGGQLYVTQIDGGVFRLEDRNGDGVFEEAIEYARGGAALTGATFGPEGRLYLSSPGRVTVVRDTNGDTIGDSSETIVSGLPTGNHQNNSLVFGPDGKLYITLGSTCNDCVEEDGRSATILQANADGSDVRVYARGLRNSYDILFDPQGRLWATDNGSDPTDPDCNTIDELNLVEEGGDYGWPYFPACDSFASGIPPVGNLGFNTASTGLAYYGGDHFPRRYQGNIFITLWGRLHGPPEPAGHIVVRAIITETPAGPVARVEEFGTGFANPIDVIVDEDGTLLVLDFGTGKLYRIVYTP
ncbi:MAG: PQQ-dependent sugar dehydrogenase [Chloroflexi bacterium]|nr:PQQ-dependent sugar dehydrogenase [Chloroflexota bacterium]